MMKNFNLKKISQAVALGFTSTIIGLFPNLAHASDIEIYKAPESGKKTVMMMLDTSGSMTYCDSVPGHNEGNGRVTVSNIGTKTFDGVQGRGEKKKEISKSGISYDAEICWIGNVEHPTRGTRLLRAMFELIDSDSLDDTLVLGVGRFNFGGTRASIDIPAQPLTPAHRARIRAYLGGVVFSGGTPTATSYAEVAAYMMGTTTDVPLAKQFITKEVYWPAADNAQWVACGGWSGEVSCRTGDGTQNWQRENQLIQNRNLFKAPCRLAGQYDCWSDRTQGVDVDVPAEIKNNNLPYETSVSFKEFLGFSHAHPDTKAGSKYKSPLPTSKTERDCSGQAIYFLTDGYPNNTYESQYLMRTALDTKAGDFPRKYSDFTSGLGTRYLNANNSEGMAQVGELAKRLRDPDRNPSGVAIKTAVVGFGSVFEEANQFKKTVTTTNKDTGKTTTRVYYDCSGITTREIKNACYWGAKSYDGFVGGYGEGGFYYAKDSQDVINSLLQVVDDIETKTGEVATGTPTIPFDPLNFSASDKAYYASFAPKPETQQQLWAGNMNKYNVTNGTLLSGSNNIPLFTDTGGLNKNAKGLWDHATDGNLTGASGQLLLKTAPGRTLFTNRDINNGTAVNTSTLQKVNLDALYSGRLAQDPYKNYWINALGYNVPVTENIARDKLATQPELRQLGAVMHSRPVFITQQANIDDDSNISLRQDFIVYGTTQGMLHVVNAATGEEKLSFVPHEMLESQKEALLEETMAKGGRENLFYGIDGAWTAHSVYTRTASGLTTVLSQSEGDGAHQWLYGGLRMGGRSYYGLDLSNMDNPKMLFHIDPKAQKVYGKTEKSYSELQFMGESWSKPALAHINWRNAAGKVERKLVMIVGGGYDRGYEQSNYVQTNKLGAGVYMFDAESGDLLWWTSANEVTSPSTGVYKTTNTNLKYSVVSRINTLDRDGDDLIDALYFGDLGGQAFRVDINNDATTNAAMFVRTERILNENVEGGLSPRFYEMPSIAPYTQSIADKGDGKAFMTVSFGSGDRSSPLAGTNQNLSGQTVVTPTAQDGVFVIYDNDIARTDLYALAQNAPLITTATQRLLPSDLTNGVPQMTDGKYNLGWKYTGEGVAGTQKFTLEPFSFKSQLFINVYEKDNGGQQGECGGGVIGSSPLLSFCMPTGKCDVNKHGHSGNGGKPNRSEGNVGISGYTVGAGVNTEQIRVVGGAGGPPDQACLPNDPRPACAKLACKPGESKCISADISPKINQLRWYESN